MHYNMPDEQVASSHRIEDHRHSERSEESNSLQRFFAALRITGGMALYL